MPRYGRPPRGGNGIFTAIIGVIILIALLESLLEIILPIILIAGGGYGVYYLATKQTRLEKVNTEQRLQDLKDSIRLLTAKLNFWIITLMKKITRNMLSLRANYCPKSATSKLKSLT